MANVIYRCSHGTASAILKTNLQSILRPYRSMEVASISFCSFTSVLIADSKSRIKNRLHLTLCAQIKLIFFLPSTRRKMSPFFFQLLLWKRVFIQIKFDLLVLPIKNSDFNFLFKMKKKSWESVWRFRIGRSAEGKFKKNRIMKIS